MSKFFSIASVVALHVLTSTAYAQTSLSTTYTATPSSSSTVPYINYDVPTGQGLTYLSSPFSESLTVGQATTATPLLAVVPTSGSGNETGTIAVAFTFALGTSSVTNVTSSDGNGTLSGGAINVTANYGMNYTTSTDCIAWNGPCSPPSSNTGNSNTATDTLTVTFSNNAVLAVTLYNWQDWVMQPEISFNLLTGPQTVPAPEPASLAVFATSLAALGAARRRRRGRNGSTNRSFRA
jgi:hypothetical protein